MNALAIALFSIFGTVASVTGVVIYVFNGTRNLIKEMHETQNKIVEMQNKIVEMTNEIKQTQNKIVEMINEMRQTQNKIVETLANQTKILERINSKIPS